VGAELKEGDITVIGTLTASGQSSSSNRMNQMMFMGGSPGGGRR
jgi:hypothetical protein